MAPRRAAHNKPAKTVSDERPAKRQRKAKSTSLTVSEPASKPTERHADAEPPETAKEPSDVEQSAVTKQHGNVDEPERGSTRQQDPKIETHRLFHTREIVDFIAEELAAVDCFGRDFWADPDEPFPARMALDQNITLKNFRLVSRMFAAAGARQLFGTLELSQTEGQRRLVDDPPGRERNHPAEKIHYLKMFGQQPQAKTVRSLYVDMFACGVGTGPFGVISFLQRGLPTNDRLRRDHTDPTNMAKGWLVKTLRQFPNIRHVCLMSDERRDHGLLIDAIASARLKIHTLELEPAFPTQYQGPECLETASMSSILANVRVLHLPLLIRYMLVPEYPNHDEVCARTYRAVKTVFKNARKLKELRIANWAYDYNSSIRELPLKLLPCLTTLHLAWVQTSCKALTDFLHTQKQTLRDLDLVYVSLASGYWADVFEVLAPMLPKMTHFVANLLQYQPAGLNGRIPMPIGALHSWWYDQFGPLRTLNLNDRKALSTMLQNAPLYHQKRLFPFSDLTSEDQRDFHTYQALNVPIVRCAGVKKGGTRCSRDTKVVLDKKLGWIYKSGSIGLAETWLCHLHRGQAERFLIWPWEDGYVSEWQGDA